MLSDIKRAALSYLKDKGFIDSSLDGSAYQFSVDAVGVTPGTIPHRRGSMVVASSISSNGWNKLAELKRT